MGMNDWDPRARPPPRREVDELREAAAQALASRRQTFNESMLKMQSAREAESEFYYWGNGIRWRRKMQRAKERTTNVFALLCAASFIFALARLL